MAGARNTLLFSGLAAVLVVSGCVPFFVAKDAYPHYPILQLADPNGNLHWFEVDAEIVEAVFVAPASPGRTILFERMRALGMEPDSAETVDLYSYLIEEQEVRFIVPEEGQDIPTPVGFVVTQLSGTVTGSPGRFRIAPERIWARAREQDLERVNFQFQVGGQTQEITGLLFTEMVRLANRLEFSPGHNPEGGDECIKIRDCQLVCDEEEN
jgi:hypothetical protein